MRFNPFFDCLFLFLCFLIISLPFVYAVILKQNKNGPVMFLCPKVKTLKHECRVSNTFVSQKQKTF